MLKAASPQPQVPMLRVRVPSRWRQLGSCASFVRSKPQALAAGRGAVGHMTALASRELAGESPPGLVSLYTVRSLQPQSHLSGPEAPSAAAHQEW